MFKLLLLAFFRAAVTFALFDRVLVREFLRRRGIFYLSLVPDDDKLEVILLLRCFSSFCRLALFF